MSKNTKEAVNHPSHYGGASNVYEHIKVVDAWGLDYRLGNATKYIIRAGRKNPKKTIEDLKKAIFYIQSKVDKLEQQQLKQKPNGRSKNKSR